MTVHLNPSALRQTKWHEYAVRFLFGGLITAAVGIITKKFGPGIGGLFLAFPAIFPASATLIEKHVKEKKDELDWTVPSARERPRALMRRARPEAALDLWHLHSWFGGYYRITALTSCWLVPPWYGSECPSLSGSFTGTDLSGDSWETVKISFKDTEG